MLVERDEQDADIGGMRVGVGDRRGCADDAVFPTSKPSWSGVHRAASDRVGAQATLATFTWWRSTVGEA
jgi:hypothetical protein